MMHQVGAPVPGTFLSIQRAALERRFQYYLDKSVPRRVERWVGTGVTVFVYFTRTFALRGFYIVTYAIGIYLLNLLMGFLTPAFLPEKSRQGAPGGLGMGEEEDDDGPSLPMQDGEEFKPFVRKLPEFKFWFLITRAFALGFCATFFPVFDVPVFWPILLMYWIMLLYMTMKKQVLHMLKHKYVPFSMGKKQSYAEKGSAGEIRTGGLR